MTQIGELILEDGTRFKGELFGCPKNVAGEVVFNTGMVGYPETLTDPSYEGEILVLTYPMIGNYGVPLRKVDSNGLPEGFESDRIHALGLVICDLSEESEHYGSGRSLSDWLKEEKIVGISGIDTRALTQRLREKGTMLGKIVKKGGKIELHDPNKTNLVAQVSCREPRLIGNTNKKVILVDCGAKASIIRSLLTRGISVLQVPWNYDFVPELKKDFAGVIISNGPGDPKMADETVKNVRKVLETGKPVFGICLGNQIMALASGADTYKLKYGHRSQNQPATDTETNRCYITSQNHGYAVRPESLKGDFSVWFTNANDGTVEGIRHKKRPFFAVQFHPEANPGPTDTAFLFDRFAKLL